MEIFSVSGKIKNNVEYITVRISAASLIKFDVRAVEDYDQQLIDICQIIPTMIKVDIDLMEFYDSPSTKKQPKNDDLKAIEKFYKKYKFKNCQVGFKGFVDNE